MSDVEIKSILKTMLVPIGIAVGFVLWGAMIFWTVGDRIVTRFNFGTIEDVPGLSPYSVIEGPEVGDDIFLQLGPGIPPQHVDHAPEEPPPVFHGTSGENTTWTR